MTKHLTAVLALLLGMVLPSNGQSGVKAWEGTLSLPTYTREAPETAPIFERDWSYQRARRSVYPYVLDDNMTRNRVDSTYRAVFLENEYVQLCVLPDIGGRLFYAIDKTNGYDIFYHQHVVKPANVGMLGAWISGGVEWNVFHHHRATTNMTVNCRIGSEADGGKTIWIGETELRHRMQWAIGITLRPGKSYMEIRGRLINSTPDDNSYLYWSNVSTKVDSTYQIIFPESTDFVTFHCKNWFAHWPVTHEPFNGMDFYKEGVDASWWKNHFMSNSMFVHDLKEDFVAGYDHGQHAGTLLTADHNISKGGKFWLWGPNSMWDTKILTDSDGHYIELMMGAYSDNQPDYSWSTPGETREFTQYFYGIRELGGVKKASREAALNLQPLGGGRYLAGVNATSRKALTFRIEAGGKNLLTKELTVSPAMPWTDTLSLDAFLQPSDLTVSLLEGDDCLLCYTPRADRSDSKPLPPIVERPARPRDIASTEECYLTGLRNLQFHNPFVEPEDYFLEVLRRDPEDTRANTQMGVLCRKRGLYDESAAYLRRALRRLTHDYTRPKDSEALYNLGLVLKAQGKEDEAMDTLYRAAWNYTYNSAANYELATLYLRKGDRENARIRLNEAIRYNAANLRALSLRATLSRLEGKKASAMKDIEALLSENPLDARATFEKDLLSGGKDHLVLMRDDPEQYLELALGYLDAGCKDEALSLLRYIDSKSAYPSIKMWIGYLTADKTAFDQALSLPVTACNPFRLESLPVLEMAATLFPNSAKPWYWRGCLLYNKQQDTAAAQWETAVSLDPSMDLAWRNLGWYHWLYKKDYAQAARCYAKAVAIAPDKALYLEEQDQVLEALGTAPEKRFEILRDHHKTALKRYYPLAAEVKTGTFAGEYDYVLDLLRNCYFPTREGVANFHDIYVDALLLAGRETLDKGDASKAIELYKEAFTYPVNHQVFLVDERTPRDAEIYVAIARAYEIASDKEKALENWKAAAAVDTKNTDYRYWKAVALKHLGEKKAAKEIFRSLVKGGKGRMVSDVVNFYGAEGTTGATVEGINAAATYTRALGENGLGHRMKTRRLMAKVLKLNPAHLGAKTFDYSK